MQGMWKKMYSMSENRLILRFTRCQVREGCSGLFLLSPVTRKTQSRSSEAGRPTVRRSARFWQVFC